MYKLPIWNYILGIWIYKSSMLNVTSYNFCSTYNLISLAWGGYNFSCNFLYVGQKGASGELQKLTDLVTIT